MKFRREEQEEEHSRKSNREGLVSAVYFAFVVLVFQKYSMLMSVLQMMSRKSFCETKSAEKIQTQSRPRPPARWRWIA